MNFPELIIKAHGHFYPNGGDDLENVRFFANLALILANRLQSGQPTTEQDLMELAQRAESIEKRIKAEQG